jgi:hypothetical protein
VGGRACGRRQQDASAEQLVLKKGACAAPLPLFANAKTADVLAELICTGVSIKFRVCRVECNDRMRAFVVVEDQSNMLPSCACTLPVLCCFLVIGNPDIWWDPTPPRGLGTSHSNEGPGDISPLYNKPLQNLPFIATSPTWAMANAENT